MSLVHNWATRIECSRRVVARSIKCERKVARAEHGNGAEWHQQATKLRAREWSALRVTAIDSRADPRAFVDCAGDQHELIHSAPPLTL